MKKILVILFALASVSGYAAFGLNDAFDDLVNQIEGKLYSLQNFINKEYTGENIVPWTKFKNTIRKRKVNFESISYGRPQLDVDVIDSIDSSLYLKDRMHVLMGKMKEMNDLDSYRRLTFDLNLEVPNIRVKTKYLVKGALTGTINIRRTITVKSSNAKINVRYMMENTSAGVRLSIPIVSVDMNKLGFNASGDVGDDIVEWMLDCCSMKNAISGLLVKWTIINHRISYGAYLIANIMSYC